MHNLQLYIMWIGLSQQSIQIFLRPDPHPSTQKFNDLNSMSSVICGLLITEVTHIEWVVCSGRLGIKDVAEASNYLH